MSFLRDEGPDAGRELAWVMAEALAACERYAGALAHLDAARATGPLPHEYESTRIEWESQRNLQRGVRHPNPPAAANTDSSI